MRECKLATQEPCNGQSTVGQPRFEQHWAQTARLLCNEGRSGMDPETVTTWRCRQTTKDNPQHKTNLNYKQKPSSKRGEIRHGKGTNCTEYSMLTPHVTKGRGPRYKKIRHYRYTKSGAGAIMPPLSVNTVKLSTLTQQKLNWKCQKKHTTSQFKTARECLTGQHVQTSKTITNIKIRHFTFRRRVSAATRPGPPRA
jgi:hypothetical protein